ncbi:MAG: flagellar hook-basal body complex protein FliE [Lachnospiraceae bacterium]|nr:flagellar hook-basal body complex protein FliE [Lachnospiraceae bacterium]
MDLSALSGVDLMTAFETPTISSKLVKESDSLLVKADEERTAFDSIFQSALNLIEETNAYSNAAEEEEIKYSLGESDSIHDLQIAQQKANVSLQYTVAVRDAVVEAYRDIMNMQF